MEISDVAIWPVASGPLAGAARPGEKCLAHSRGMAIGEHLNSLSANPVATMKRLRFPSLLPSTRRGLSPLLYKGSGVLHAGPGEGRGHPRHECDHGIWIHGVCRRPHPGRSRPIRTQSYRLLRGESAGGSQRTRFGAAAQRLTSRNRAVFRIGGESRSRGRIGRSW